ncbi:asparagine--tRNA ligase [Sarracenia purpurea var. burkii]
MSADSFPPTDEMSAVTLTDAVEESQFSQRVLIRHIIGRPDARGRPGWPESEGRRVIVDTAVLPLGQLVPTGTCVHVEGELKVPPEGTKQRIELMVHKVLDVGFVDPAKYPLPKTRLTLEFLRDYVHLRPKTNTMLYCDWKCHPKELFLNLTTHVA